MKTLTMGICVITLFSCNTQHKINYPNTKKVEVEDKYFSTTVKDPYRWLEDDRSKETEEWVKEENKITSDYISKIPFTNKLQQRLTHLTNYERSSAPFKKNGRLYFSKNDGLQNQSVIYVKENENSEAKVFLDPNKLSDDGTVALKQFSFSKDGKYFAYVISRSGSDWQEIYVMEVATGKKLDDHILWAKFSGASWQGNGFYYSAYDSPKEGKEFSNINEGHKIYYHKIGTPQAQDKLIYENKKYPKRFYQADISEDESFMFITESGEGLGNALFFKDLRHKNSKVVSIADDFRYSYMPIDNIGDKIFVLTNYNAPKNRVMIINANKPDIKYWKEIIKENTSVLSNISIIDNKLVLTYDKDASNHIYVHNTNGDFIQEIKLPTLGSAGIRGEKDESIAYYTFTSFTFPTTIYKIDMNNYKSKVFSSPKVDFKPEEYVTEQVFYPSKDGVKIPMFITYKKGIKKNGANPVLLYGYGGFNISLNPSFSTMRIPFLENGGIYAQANLRGGGEYGEEWHIAGTKMNKQNVFDDFISAAEYLINNKYTNSKKLAIMGGSNGGLLVGACANQRPDLFQVAIPQVGVMDMLRYHKFTIGWNWAPDYGTSEDSEEMFKYLYNYSPIHNIKKNTEYPAILVTTADHDDRVVPAHSFKYIAGLQEVAGKTNKKPLLIRVESNAGHGAGKPMSKVLEEYAEIYSFIMYNLNMDFKSK